MTEQRTDTTPVYELSKAEGLLSGSIEPGKTFEELLDGFKAGTSNDTEIFNTLTWLEYAIDRKRHAHFPSAPLDNMQSIINFVGGEARQGHKSVGSLGAQGRMGPSSIRARLDKDLHFRKQIQEMIAPACEWLMQEELFHPEDRLPTEISQDDSVREVITDAHTLLSELANSADAVDDRIRHINTKEATSGLFGIINDRIQSGLFRVFMTHDQDTSRYSPPDTYANGLRVIELRAESANDMGGALKRYCEDADLKPKQVEALTGMTFEELGLRYVLMHELGHAIHMAPVAWRAIQEAFLIEHPQEAVSANFEDALAAERERFAEGLALYHFKSLLIRAGFNEPKALDSITESVQRDSLISNQEWFAKAKGSPKSLGRSKRNSMNGARLGYGLTLDGTELLERLDFVGQSLAVDHGFGSRTANEKGIFVDLQGRGWAEYLDANGVDLTLVHDRVEHAKVQKLKYEKHKARVENRKDILAIGFLASVAVFGGYIANEIMHRYDTTPVERTVIEALNGNHYAVDEVFPDGRVVFELEEPATTSAIEDSIAQLGDDNFVVGKDKAGNILFIGQDLQQWAQVDETRQNISVFNEVYQRLPEDIKLEIRKSKELQVKLSKLVNENSKLDISSDAIISQTNLEAIANRMKAEIDK